ncbi:MAG: M48 family metallopeptidase [Planctomycetes bacterium]|nr:M48 family metallopeptidase [Planctomycetota bacterium]
MKIMFPQGGYAMRRFHIILILWAMLPLAGCSINPATGRNQLILVSSKDIMAMGISAKPELIEQYGGETDSTELRGYVRRVGLGLVEHVESVYIDLPWEFVVLESDQINAFALPGGKVFITIGLLSKLSSEGQLAGVLSHEIGHVTARHVDERISHAMTVQGLLSVLDASGQSGATVIVGGFVGSSYLLSFNRDQETEADGLGLTYLTRSYYDPYGMMEVLEILKEASGKNRSIEFFSTHPHPETRIKNVEELLSGPFASTQNNPEYRMYKDRFQREATPYLPDSGQEQARNQPIGSYCLVCVLRKPRIFTASQVQTE